MRTPAGALVITALLTALWSLLATPPAWAQEAELDSELAQGAVSWDVSAGYDGYALPVANSALARPMAAQRGLKWQVGLNYSVVPVRVTIEHRQAIALSGRIEVSADYGYALEEDPLQHPTVLSQEILVPPSQPLTLYFAPRVCPPLEPGSELPITVRFYNAGSPRPAWEEVASVIPLEPAHLYSLLLGETGSGILADQINPGNKQSLALPRSIEQSVPEGTLGLLEFGHYLIPVDPEVVTGQPLAARDFAFVAADARSVAGWSAEQQRQLCAYVIGGGYLCLYGTAGMPLWEGLALGSGPVHAGRGVLLPVAGGLDKARAAMRDWITGELSEMVLLAGGTWQGHILPISLTVQGLINLQGAWSGPGVISHNPGYLHPVWVYRETARSGALEPWDYPEFTFDYGPRVLRRRAGGEPLLDNSNLRETLPYGFRASIPTLADLAQPPHMFPRVAALVILACLLGCTAALTLRRWPQVVLPAVLAALALGGGVASYLTGTPPPPEPRRLVMVDADLRADAQVRRDLVAGASDFEGGHVSAVPRDALLRFVRWSRPGELSWQFPAGGPSGSGESHGWIRGGGGSGYWTIATQSVVNDRSEIELPVKVRVEAAVGTLRLHIDTSALSADKRCWLVTPTGQQLLPGGEADFIAEMRQPQITAVPGPARLAAWLKFLDGRQDFAGPDEDGNPFTGNGSWSLLERFTMPYLSTFIEEASRARDIESLCWLGVLQQPSQLRGLLTESVTLFIPAGDLTSLGFDEPTETFIRLSLPMELPQ